MSNQLELRIRTHLSMKLCENINVRQILLDFNDISTSQARKKVEDRWTMDDGCLHNILFNT